MKKLGFSEFEVELGEEIELTIHSPNLSHLPVVYLDGNLVEPLLKHGTISYQFQVRKPEGQFHQCIVRLPHLSLLERFGTGYKLELFGSGTSVTSQTIKPGHREALGDLVYTFSTHGSGGGSNE